MFLEIAQTLTFQHHGFNVPAAAGEAFLNEGAGLGGVAGGEKGFGGFQRIFNVRGFEKIRFGFFVPGGWAP